MNQNAAVISGTPKGSPHGEPGARSARGGAHGSRIRALALLEDAGPATQRESLSMRLR